MKKLLILLLAACISNLAFAQWSGTNPVYFNNGSVGVGTSSPSVWFAASRLLQIEGARPVLSLKSSGTLGTISFTNNQVSSSNRYGEFHLNHSFLITDPGKSTLGFWSYPGGNTLTLQADGNVGIGTAIPNAKLEILSNGSITQGAELRLQHANNNTNDIVSTVNFANNAGSVAKIEAGTVGANNSGYISMFTDNNGASSERMRITHEGYVGIGTNSPSEKLEVKGSMLIDSGVGGGLFLNTNSGVNIDLRFREAGVNKFNLGYIAANDAMGLYDNTSQAYRWYVASNGNMGIGTNSPSATLHIQNPTNNTVALQVGPAGNSHSYFKLDKHIGKDGGIIFTENQANQYQLVNNTTGNFDLYSYSRADIVFSVQKNSGNVGIGTTTPGNKLEVNGTIRSKKVKVDANGWPDYVFAPSYKLRPLSEVENYIKANHHLPEVPSAKEVAANGLDLGSMDATLLKKVEELTLYTIDQQKTIDKQAKENQKLNDRLVKIEALLKTLTSK